MNTIKELILSQNFSLKNKEEKIKDMGYDFSYIDIFTRNRKKEILINNENKAVSIFEYLYLTHYEGNIVQILYEHWIAPKSFKSRKPNMKDEEEQKLGMRPYNRKIWYIGDFLPQFEKFLLTDLF